MEKRIAKKPQFEHVKVDTREGSGPDDPTQIIQQTVRGSDEWGNPKVFKIIRSVNRPRRNRNIPFQS